MKNLRFAFLALACLGPLLVGATVPAGFVDAQFGGGGLAGPTAMAFAPDGRLFVCEQGVGAGPILGRVRVIKNGALLATPFHSTTVDYPGGSERGLLGICFDPNFTVNGYVYIYFTNTTGPHNCIRRLRANPPSSDTSDASETAILDLETLVATNHNGGAIHFGPDGKLYVAVGENANAPYARSVANRLGKILRINADGTIPGDNPLSFTVTDGAGNNPMVVSPAGVNQAIWALGLRNPFTFAFQPGTGRMFINDVGQGTYEEINDGIAGSNYGWLGGNTDGPTANVNFRGPISYYSQAGPPGGCAITGGAFYNPPAVQFPASYVGLYFYADYCGNWIYTYNPSTGAVAPFATGASAPVDIQVGQDGALYYLNRGGSEVRRVTYTGVATQNIIVSTNQLAVNAGSSATFNVHLAISPGGTPLDVNVEQYIGDASVTVSPPVLTFTSGNFGTDQVVTVTAAADADTSNDGATTRLFATGVTTQYVVVTAFENPPPAGPTATIAKPLNGDIVSGSVAEFFGNGVGAGMTRADFYVDGVLVSTDTNGTGHYHFGGAGHNGWDTTGLTNATHVIRMTVTGSAGAGSHEITVVVNNAAGGGGGGGGCGCGLSGLEPLLLLGLLAMARRRRRR